MAEAFIQQWPELKLRWWTQTQKQAYRIYLLALYSQIIANYCPIPFSCRSKIFSGGRGCYLPKTTWKWKNLVPRGASLEPPPRSTTDFLDTGISTNFRGFSVKDTPNPMVYFLLLIEQLTCALVSPVIIVMCRRVYKFQILAASWRKFH